MKSFKMNNLQRLVSFLLIAMLLVGAVGFAVNGWQSTDDANNNSDDEQNSDSDENNDNNTDEDNNSSNNVDDENNDTTVEDELPPVIETPPPVIEEPKYYSAITGLEITENLVNKTPLGFVVNPSLPLYGLSNSELVIEFPTEIGDTRLLAYTTNDSLLWKVGSLTKTRDFISSSSNFFGGVVISNGEDDLVQYNAWDSSKVHLDISKYTDCYYIENTTYVYTSKDMIDTAIGRNTALGDSPYKSAPFYFCENDTQVIGAAAATTVSLPYSEVHKSEFYYSEQSNEYLFFKDGKRKVDMLTGKNISFTNIFVLFANSTTYERSDGTELVLDTTSGGKGYYFSHGYSTEITWSINTDGELEFKTLDGQRLIVNRGNSYIGYYKSSIISNVSFN